MSKVGINGFGRIGRLVLRRLLEVKSNIDVVAINDLTSPKILAYLLKHDSNYGPFPWSVDFTEDSLIVDGKSIAVYAEKEAKNIPWKAKGAEIIVECTGFYTSAEKSQAHLDAGAKKVLISAPAGEMKLSFIKSMTTLWMATTPLFPWHHALLTVLRRWPKPCMTVSG